MTREEAKSILFDMLGDTTIIEPTEQNQAILTAIKALQKEPCEDAISKQAVLSKIKEVCFSKEWVQFRVDNGSNGQRDFLINYIKQLPPVTPQPKWIPVSERLPESCGMYIVTRKIYDCPDTAPIIMSDESWFDGQNTWHNDNRINHERGYLFDVIAWQPLPEPYKAESER